MLQLHRQIGSFLLLVVLASSCTSVPVTPSHSEGGMSSYKEDRAPASMQPLYTNLSKDVLDHMHLRTQADFHFAQGEALALDGQTQKAIESFKTVLVYDPDATRVQVRIAAEYVKLGMLSEALTHIESAIQEDPKSVEALLLKAGILSTLKEFPQAIKTYEAVLKVEPSNLESPMYLGAIAAEQKRYDDALKYFEVLAQSEEYGTPHLAWYYMGRIHLEKGLKSSPQSAAKAFKKALESKPNHVDSALALASISFSAKKDSEAIRILTQFQTDHGVHGKISDFLSQYYLESENFEEAYVHLKNLEPLSEEPMNIKLRLALVCIELKRYVEAISKLQEVLKLEPESDKIRFYLAAVYEQIDQSDSAIENYLKIPFESSFYPESRLHSTLLLKKSGDLKKALEVAEEGFQKRPDVAQMHSLYASLLDDNSQPQEAKAILEKAVQKFPDQVQLQFYFAAIFDRFGDKKSVLSQMKKVIEMDPNHVQGLNYLAFTLAELDQNLEEAEQFARRAHELDPEDGYILDTLGWVVFKQGRSKEALKFLEQAHHRAPEEAIISEHLGDVYFKLQLTERAKAQYLHALKFEKDESKSKILKEKLANIESQKLGSAAERQPASTP